MPNKLQFTVRNALIATTIMAVWFALMASVPTRFPNVRGAFVVMLGVGLVMGTLPAAAVGALFGRLWFGAVCGATGVGGLIIWTLSRQ